MLIVFPLGLLSTAALFDLAFVVSERQTFALLAYWLIPAGLIGGVLSAIVGWIDWTAIPSETRAKSVGLLHGCVNAVVLIIFFIGWYLRPDSRSVPGSLPILLSVIGVLLALLGGWLGGELVERLGIGVHPGANPNAPSSLKTDSAVPNAVEAERL
jgi:uncharacterized membrane protein